MLVGTHIMNNFKRNAKGKCKPQHLEYLMAVELNLRNLSFRGPYRAFIMGLSVTCWLSSVSFQLFCKLVGWYLSPFPSIYACKFLSFFFSSCKNMQSIQSITLPKDTNWRVLLDFLNCFWWMHSFIFFNKIVTHSSVFLTCVPLCDFKWLLSC